jgi:hypothetical protein
VAEERTQRRLVAILAADVVGYSRLMESDEAGTLAALNVRRKKVLEPTLGLAFDPDTRTICFNRPHLPPFLDDVTLRGLSLGDGSVDVLLHRHGSAVTLTILSRRGDLRVLTIG